MNNSANNPASSEPPKCTCDNASGLHWGKCPLNMKNSEPPKEERGKWTASGKFGIHCGAETFMPQCYDTGSRDILVDAHNAAIKAEREAHAETQERANIHAEQCGKAQLELKAERDTIRFIRETNRLLSEQLLQAQAAIEKHNDDCWPHCHAIDVDLSALREHDAEVKIEGWTEGREHERKCADAVRKPLVDALTNARRQLTSAS